MLQRPLIVRLCNWIGDVVLGVPALELLEAQGYMPLLYGKRWAATLLSGYPWTVHVRSGTLQQRVHELKALAAACRLRDADFARRVNALVMPNSLSSALELRLAGLRTAGYARDGRGLLLAQRIAPPRQPHELERMLALASALTGAPAPAPQAIGFRVAAAAQTRTDVIVRERGWQRGYLCLVPFATGIVNGRDKRWPGFAALAARLASAGHVVVICPGPGAETAEARSRFAQAEIVEDLPLDTYAALLRGSRLVVANDTGPGHLAAAVGAPLLSVLGPTTVAQHRAWGPNVQLLQAASGWPEVEQVLAAALQLLALQASGPATPAAPTQVPAAIAPAAHGG
ncbi:MAG: glycosyltransferase family 9 protein [Burkholderiales bacterium]|nr:glycosyltransferase family 9 protein [Burkholderiales bacterium]